MLQEYVVVNRYRVGLNGSESHCLLCSGGSVGGSVEQYHSEYRVEVTIH